MAKFLLGSGAFANAMFSAYRHDTGGEWQFYAFVAIVGMLAFISVQLSER